MSKGPSIDLNADLGEGFPHDAELLGLVTSASICCGAHAGDPGLIRSTLRVAREKGVVVGAHPGYPDREGFGRREMVMSAERVEDLIRSQLADLRRLADAEGVAVRFLKPHGALYNQAQRDSTHGAGVLAAARGLNLPVVGLPGTPLAKNAEAAGVRFLAEGFPERRYRPDGSLVPRSEPNAVLDDPAEVDAQLSRLVKGGVATLCIHGDAPKAVEWANRVRASLQKDGIAVRPWTN